jgi:hypothetical protein
MSGKIMVSAINDAFMQFDRRAEASDPAKLVATFVNVGALATLISGRDHQVIFGRRGTGKTHALKYLRDDRHKKKDVPIYIDLRTVGSSAGIYTDPNRTLPERSTVLLRDVLAAMHVGLLDHVLGSDEFDLSKCGPILDDLVDTISATRVVGAITVKDASEEKSKDETTAKIGLGFRTGINLDAGFGGTDTRERVEGRKVEYQIEPQSSVIFGAVDSALRRFSDLVAPKRIWLLLDEWSTIPIDLQPYLADLIRRAVLPAANVTVKIAAIEHRTKFRLGAGSGTYVGIEVGADAAADINLDDFMVFENNPNRATAFFADLVYRHFLALSSKDFASADALISAAFTQRNAFDELVKAAEGVPRDAINILGLAAQKALDDRITMNHVRSAARDWYQRDKSRALTEHAELEELLNWIIDNVIGSRRARAFLLSTTASDRRIEELFDARLLHILKKNVSSNEQPGVRYLVYKVDYGCYVGLINTARSPTRLFEAQSDSGDAFDVEVPDDDYRSIRRAILDLDMYAEILKLRQPGLI